jgi:hypothetical protein
MYGHKTEGIKLKFDKSSSIFPLFKSDDLPTLLHGYINYLYLAKKLISTP